MTFQVALVGTDGIVIASDRKTLTIGGIVHSNLGTKIEVDGANKLVVAWSGEIISRTVAMRVKDYLGQPDSELHAETLERKAKEVYDQTLTDPLDELGHTSAIILVLQKHLDRIFYMQMKKDWYCMSPHDDKAIAGDRQNSAVFIAEHFYNKRPISELVVLAAYTVLCASKRNPGSIEGLEIVTCRATEIRSLSGSEIERLIIDCEKLDNDFRRILSRTY